MRSVKSITLRILLVCTGLQLFMCDFLNAQDNSPYSRYGLGDVAPNTNIANRGMGSFAAGYAHPLSINFTNPASYSAFMSYSEEKSKRTVSGRVLFDVGMNFSWHTLREGSSPNKFTSSDALFSYMQVGVPVKKNWGLNFGLRQLTRIGYKIDDFERLHDPNTGLPIDSALTEFSGPGEFLIEMQRLRVQRECAEQHVVHLGDGPAERMVERLTLVEILEIKAGHAASPW